jgi:fatty acid synthase
LVYSGQDPDWVEGVRRTLMARPELRDWAGEVMGEVAAALAANPTIHPELAAEGIDPNDWLGGAPRWSVGKLAGRHVCMMGTQLSHLCASAALAQDGLGAEAAGVRLVTGHSAGLLSAWTVARHGSQPEPDEAARAMLAFGVLTSEMDRQPGRLSESRLGAFLEDQVGPTPLLMVGGPTEAGLGELLEDAGAGDSVCVALQNCHDRWVLSGRPEELSELADRLADDDGVSQQFVSSSGIYHNPLAESLGLAAVERIRAADLALEGELSTVLLDPRDLTRHSGGDLTERVVMSMAANVVRWADAVSDVAHAGDVVIDVGPSTLTAALCRRALRGSGATVVAVGDPGERRLLCSAHEWPEPLLDYSDFLPRVVAEAEGGAARVVTRHTERSGRSSVVLAGMTPSTADAPIVAAAANAGHVAELAGGGQVSPAIFTERLAELSELLTPGHEVVFNALYLDPYLWNLHLGKDRLVQRARRNGAPICGVTISAGVPDVDEASELLDELHGLGIWLNAFKPGDIAGVRKVLAIAAQSEHDIWLHLEGGLAGGHHSWEDLESVLFQTYADIRSHDNVVLMVGGGVHSPHRSAELISGEWALRHGPRAMPVDGVLLGTVAMATRECTASASVKRALVSAPGTASPVGSGEVVGGVTSGLSGLGADIHYLDNHASRVAAVLDEVAGDAGAVEQRRGELAALLDGTAKPFFGDVERMTWSQVALRFVELCALGRHGRYEDGRWLDATHRSRFLSLLRRAEARCVDMDSGTFQSAFRGPGDLDDPGKAVDLLVERYPTATEVLLQPTDVAAFVDICDSAGKPVPFVAVIDAQVRRRYLSDSLWQSHSELWDSERVLVVPGPAALRGIDRVDEPVAGPPEPGTQDRGTGGHPGVGDRRDRCGGGRPASAGVGGAGPRRRGSRGSGCAPRRRGGGGSRVRPHPRRAQGRCCGFGGPCDRTGGTASGRVVADRSTGMCTPGRRAGPGQDESSATARR